MNEVENDFSKKKLGFKNRLPSGSIQKGLYRRMWVQQETILFLKAIKYTKRFFGLNSYLLPEFFTFPLYQWEMGLGELVAFLQY